VDKIMELKLDEAVFSLDLEYLREFRT